MINFEKNYKIYDTELLALMENFYQLYDYFKKSYYGIEMFSDYDYLQYL